MKILVAAAALAVALGGGQNVAAEPPAVVDDIQPAWSSDGRRIAFVRTIRFSHVDERTAAIFVARADGSRLRRVSPRGSLSYGPAWSPDGKRLAFVRFARPGAPGALYTMRADGSGTRPVAGAPRATSTAAPAWSPDGKSVALGSRERIYVGPTSSRAWRPVADGREPSWAPRARIANSRGCGIVSMRPDGSDESFVVGAEACIPEIGLADPDWSRDGRLAFTFSTLTGVVWESKVAVTLPGRPAWRVIARGAHPDWSPDGRRLVFSLPGGGWLGWRLHVMNADGSGVRRLRLRR